MRNLTLNEELSMIRKQMGLLTEDNVVNINNELTQKANQIAQSIGCTSFIQKRDDGIHLFFRNKTGLGLMGGSNAPNLANANNECSIFITPTEYKVYKGTLNKNIEQAVLNLIKEIQTTSF